jgi:membrane protein DedA with SNARE-associated domain
MPRKGCGVDPSTTGVRVFDTGALYAYLGIFAALVAAGIGAPIPEEVPILAAGVMVGHAAEPAKVEAELLTVLSAAPDAPFPANLPWSGFALQVEHPELWQADHYHRLPLKWWIMLPVCILGVVISDGLLYGMGRFWGPKLLESRWMKRMLSHNRRQRIEENFQKYGVLVLLFARFLPAIRSPIFIMAGITRVSFARFLLADGLYAIPGVTLLFTLAFWFGDRMRELIERAEGRLKTVVILAALTGVAAYLLYHLFRHPVATGDPNVEMPIIGPQIAEKMSHVIRSKETHVPGKNSEEKPESTEDAAAPDHSTGERGA